MPLNLSVGRYRERRVLDGDSYNGNAVAAAGFDVINISYVGILAEDIYHRTFFFFFFFKFLVTKITAKENFCRREENCYSALGSCALQPNRNVTICFV
jgi:hypothetical protein